MKVLVEISIENESFLVSSPESKNRVAAKNTCRKLIQQTTILLFKTKQKASLT
jgi:hypothetical protein